MNKFEYICTIDGTEYEFHIDTTKDDYKRVIINGHLAIEEEYTLSLNNKAYIIYYPIKIGTHEIVISINDKPLHHEYNIYVDGVSPIDGKKIDDEYKKAKNNIEGGIKHFVKE